MISEASHFTVTCQSESKYSQQLLEHIQVYAEISGKCNYQHNTQNLFKFSKK